MKKGFVALLLALAVIVLISPGIVGKLAERSMDENLEWAASESEDVVVTAARFDRGWFSSAGQHRIELREGFLHDMLLELGDAGHADPLPVLIIDTRLDHGLIPVASMNRDGGSLRPGLGNAVSTLSVAFADGQTIALPGTIYTTVGITGELRANYVLEGDRMETESAIVNWGDASIVLVSNPEDNEVRLRGQIAPVSVESRGETLLLGTTEFDLEQVPGRFGIPLGSAELAVASVSVIGGDEPVNLGALSFASSAAARRDRISASARLSADGIPTGFSEPGNVVAELRLEGADGAALGRLRRTLESAEPATGTPDPALLQADLQALVSQGLELHVDRLDLELPAGTVATRASIDVAETGTDSFSVPGLLLATTGELRVSMPASLVDTVTALYPEAKTAIALGYLRRNGDDYVVEASLDDGVFTINGAPMQVPLDSLY